MPVFTVVKSNPKPNTPWNNLALLRLYYMTFMGAGIIISHHGESEQLDMLWDLAPAVRLSIQLLVSTTSTTSTVFSEEWMNEENSPKREWMKMKLRLVAPGPALLEISLSSQITQSRISYGDCSKRWLVEGENSLGFALRTTDRLTVILDTCLVIDTPAPWESVSQLGMMWLFASKMNMV